MIFNPLYQWPFKGPFTKLFGTFLSSSMLLSSKIGIFAYICSCKTVNSTRATLRTYAS